MARVLETREPPATEGRGRGTGPHAAHRASLEVGVRYAGDVRSTSTAGSLTASATCPRGPLHMGRVGHSRPRQRWSQHAPAPLMSPLGSCPPCYLARTLRRCQCGRTSASPGCSPITCAATWPGSRLLSRFDPALARDIRVGPRRWADLQLTNIHGKLTHRGLVVPYRTSHRFATEQCGFGSKPATFRVADGKPGVECQVDFGVLGVMHDPVPSWALPDRAGLARHLHQRARPGPPGRGGRRRWVNLGSARLRAEREGDQ